MNAITQAIVNYSKLEVISIKITNATKTNFLMSIETRVTDTGPVSAVMSAMTVDMVGPGGCFGRLDLPQMKTAASGVTVHVKDQLVEIVSMDAFVAFNKSIMGDEEVHMRLENGKSTIKAMFLSAQIVFNKDVIFKGMNGPKNIMVKTEVDGTGFKNTMTTINPSPLEIDLGTLKEAFKDSKGDIIAEQTGKVYLAQGENTYVMTGTAKGTPVVGDLKIVGLGVEEDHWGNLTIVNMNAPTTVTDAFVSLCAGAKA